MLPEIIIRRSWPPDGHQTPELSCCKECKRRLPPHAPSWLKWCRDCNHYIQLALALQRYQANSDVEPLVSAMRRFLGGV